MKGMMERKGGQVNDIHPIHRSAKIHKVSSAVNGCAFQLTMNWNYTTTMHINTYNQSSQEGICVTHGTADVVGPTLRRKDP